jgi:hypothetical protein
MSYYGDIRLGDTIDIKFTTRQISGVPTNLSSGTVVAYPANSTTEVTAGITLSGSPFDSVAGLNNVRIVATSGNGYTTATNYFLVLSAGTVNSVSVIGEVVGSFSIENRSALMPTTAGRTAVVDTAGLIDANAVKVGPTGAGTAQTAGDIITAVAAVQADLPTRITKNVALAAFPFFMADSADHVTGKTGLTVTATRSLDGAAFGACANSVTELSGGWYKVSLAATDTNANTIAFSFSAAGADPVNFSVVTEPT